MRKQLLRHALARYIDSMPGEPLRLDEKYNFFSLLTHLLKGKRRWQKYAGRCRQLGHSEDGETLAEDELEHVFHKLILGSEMIALEEQYGAHAALALNAGELYLAFALHALGVALSDDIALMDRTEKDIKKEEETFRRIICLFPDETRKRTERAYLITQEREKALASGVSINQISMNGKFLWAVVIMTFLAKALHEVKYGNRAFANTFHNMMKPRKGEKESDLVILSRTFYSVRAMVQPVLDEIKTQMELNPYWEE